MKSSSCGVAISSSVLYAPNGIYESWKLSCYIYSRSGLSNYFYRMSTYISLDIERSQTIEIMYSLLHGVKCTWILKARLMQIFWLLEMMCIDPRIQNGFYCDWICNVGKFSILKNLHRWHPCDIDAILHYPTSVSLYFHVHKIVLIETSSSWSSE